MRHQELLPAVGACSLIGFLGSVFMGPVAEDLGGPGPVWVRGLAGAALGGALGVILGHRRRVSVPFAVLAFTCIFGALLFIPVFEHKPPLTSDRLPLGTAYVNAGSGAATVFVLHLAASLGLTACAVLIHSLWARRRR
jgi:hypothetical protein